MLQVNMESAIISMELIYLRVHGQKRNKTGKYKISFLNIRVRKDNIRYGEKHTRN